MPLLPRFGAISVALLALCACANQTLKPDPRDPWEKMNRVTFAFNDGLDRTIASPIARTYRKITPQPVQTGVSNFWSNVRYPITIANQFLQGQFVLGFQDTGRFLLNSIAGIGGLLDPATAAGLPKNDEDMGQTLAVWGVPFGPYLVLPVLGPSSLRDGAALVPDEYFDPLWHLNADWRLKWGLEGFRLLEKRTRLLTASEALKTIYDPYSFMRGAYFQQREYEIRNGNIDFTPADEGIDWTDEELEDPAAPEAAPAAEPAPTSAPAPAPGETAPPPG